MRYVCGWNWPDRMAGVVHCKGTMIRGARSRPAGPSDWLLLICLSGPQGLRRRSLGAPSLVTARALASPVARARPDASGNVGRGCVGEKPFKGFAPTGPLGQPCDTLARQASLFFCNHGPPNTCRVCARSVDFHSSRNRNSSSPIHAFLPYRAGGGFAGDRLALLLWTSGSQRVFFDGLPVKVGCNVYGATFNGPRDILSV